MKKIMTLFVLTLSLAVFAGGLPADNASGKQITPYVYDPGH